MDPVSPLQPQRCNKFDNLDQAKSEPEFVESISVYLRFTSPSPPLSLLRDSIQSHMHFHKLCTDSAACRALISQAKNSNNSKPTLSRRSLYHTNLLLQISMSDQTNTPQTPPFTTNNQPSSASTKSRKEEESDSPIVV